MGDPLDEDKWTPPGPKLWPDEIQHGVVPVQYTRKEKASNPFGSALKHWSTLPALSHFMLDAISVRQKSRRLCEPHAFQVPPFITMSSQRRSAWLRLLQDPSVSLTALSNGVPHGIVGARLLCTVLELRIPLTRALWFIKCVNSNEIRAYKKHNLPVQVWYSEWTDSVLKFVEGIIDAFGTSGVLDLKRWELQMEYTCDLLLRLFNNRILNRPKILYWILRSVHYGPFKRLPCVVHLINLLWKPLTDEVMAPMLSRSIALRYANAKANLDAYHRENIPDNINHREEKAQIISKNRAYEDEKNKIHALFDPILLKLAKTNRNAFIIPDLWHVIAPSFHGSKFSDITDYRNTSFIVRDPLDSRLWSKTLKMHHLLAQFTIPYNIDELVASVVSLETAFREMVHDLILRAAFVDTSASYSICILLMKIIANVKTVSVGDCASEFLLGPYLSSLPPGLGKLVNELVKANLMNVDMYLTRVIAAGIIYEKTSSIEIEDEHGSCKKLQLQILRSIPVMYLRPNTKSLLNMVLQRSGNIMPAVNLKPYINKGKSLLLGSKLYDNEIHIQNLYSTERNQVYSELVSMFKELGPDSTSPVAFIKFCDYLSPYNCETICPLYEVLSTVVRISTCIGMVNCALRQFLIRLMAFTCSDLVDSFAKLILEKLKVSSERSMDSNLSWIATDKIEVLKMAIKDPEIMFGFDRLMPHRINIVTNTPDEKPNLHQLLELHSNSRHDLSLSTILSYSEEEHFISTIRDYARKHRDFDKGVLIKLLCCNVIRMEDVICPELQNMLLFSQPNEIGLRFEDIESITRIRRKYLARRSFDSLINLVSSIRPDEVPFKFAYQYPSVFLNDLIQPCLENEALQERLLSALHVKKDELSFSYVLQRSTPFTLTYNLGLTTLLFHKYDPERIADEVFKAALSLPSHSKSLTGILGRYCPKLKVYLLTRCINSFLLTKYEDTTSEMIDAKSLIFGSLTEHVAEPLDWTFENAWKYLSNVVDKINELSSTYKIESPQNCRLDRDLSDSKEDHYPPNKSDTPESSEYDNLVSSAYSTSTDDQIQEEFLKLRKALVLLIRIVVVRKRKAGPEVVPKLESIDFTFYDDKLYHFVQDAVIVLKREEVMKHDPISAGNSMLDGLALFSRSTKMYEPLPIYPTDLIPDTNQPNVTNNRPVDLFLFETYHDVS